MVVMKKILFTLFSIFLGYHSYNLFLSLLNSNPKNYSSIDFVVISFLLCLFITGIFAFPGFVFPTNRLLGSKYYKINNPDWILRIYRQLGLSYFRKFLLFAFWGFQKNKKKYFSGRRAGLDNFIYQTKQSEFGHLGSFVIIFLLSITLAIQGYLFLTLLMFIINIIGNLYPILLQRYHRARLSKMNSGE
jgi:hypothetical protein